jgi:hypothetical protein
MVSWVPPPPPLNANVIFLQGFSESHPVYDQTQGIGAVFSWLYGYLYCKNTHNTWDPWLLGTKKHVSWIKSIMRYRTHRLQQQQRNF